MYAPGVGRLYAKYQKDYLWNSLGSLPQKFLISQYSVITRLNGIDDSGLFSFAFVTFSVWAVSLWGGRTYPVSDVKREFSSAGYICCNLALCHHLLAISAIAFCVLNGYSTQRNRLVVTFKILNQLPTRYMVSCRFTISCISLVYH